MYLLEDNDLSFMHMYFEVQAEYIQIRCLVSIYYNYIHMSLSPEVVSPMKSDNISFLKNILFLSF